MTTINKDERPLIKVLTVDSDEVKTYIERTFHEYMNVVNIDRSGIMTKPLVIEMITDNVEKIGNMLYNIEMMRICTHGTEIHVLCNNELIGLYYWESWSDGCLDEDVLWSEDAWKYVEGREETWLEKLIKVSDENGLDYDYKKRSYGGNEFGTMTFYAYNYWGPDD